MVRRSWTGAVVVAIGLVAGCGSEPAARGTEGQLLVAAGVERQQPSADAPVGATVSGLTGFGHDLLKVMGEDAEGNVVLSPLSIGQAFGMAQAGARGQTSTEIGKTLGFPESKQHEALNALLGKIATQDGPPVKQKGDEVLPPVVAIANGLFVQEGFDVKQDFLRVLAEQYGAGAQAVDFEGGTASGPVNAWVRKQTADRIDKLFDEISTDTRLVLANAVYLKASWAHRFSRSDTKDEAFHRKAGDVRVPMMHDEATVRYAAGDGWQAVELPYAKGDLAMWVLVPKGSAAPLGLLSPATLKTVGDNLSQERVKIALPRWDFATKIELKPELEKLGMKVPFTPDADFSGITGAERLQILQAVHRANITVDENGTEAAAVTGIGVGITSDPGPAQITVRADHPFAFAIVHKPTRTPLFMGQVADPSAR